MEHRLHRCPPGAGALWRHPEDIWTHGPPSPQMISISGYKTQTEGQGQRHRRTELEKKNRGPSWVKKKKKSKREIEAE